MVDILLGMLFQGLGLLMPFHRNFGISGAIENPHNIPISLSIVGHKSLELWLSNSVLGHLRIKVLLKNYLSILVFKLEVEAMAMMHW